MGPAGLWVMAVLFKTRWRGRHTVSL